MLQFWCGVPMGDKKNVSHAKEKVTAYIYIFKANIYKHQYEHSTRTDEGFCLVKILCSDH